MSKKNISRIHPGVVRPRTTRISPRPNQLDDLLTNILVELREMRKQISAKPSIPSSLGYAEAAALLSIGESTLQSYIHQGLLKRGRHYFKIKGLVSFPPDLVDRIMVGQFDESLQEGTASRRPVAKPSSRKLPGRALANRATINENY